MSAPLDLSPALWIRATILGWFLGFAFVVALSENHLALGAGSGAVLLAVLQSLIVRRQSPQAAGRWLAPSIMAWWVVAGSIMLINYTMKAIAQPLLGFFMNLTLNLIGGPLLGLLTSPLMTKVVNRERITA